MRSATTWRSMSFFFFQAEDGIRDDLVTGVQTCALPISLGLPPGERAPVGPRRAPRGPGGIPSEPALRLGARGLSHSPSGTARWKQSSEGAAALGRTDDSPRTAGPLAGIPGGRAGDARPAARLRA